ncbi:MULTISPECIES: membrane lipoprotein lipid attachment site-containing protein [Peptoniphilus]|uniref:membrane lipoprotein lipid attachment site-containing protein n=1 Tax=Peptoniphilus TaxID=162289 RepID=UPI0001DAA420|nr:MULTISPECIES: membrane lipoprotein lipid attachment site-containing protein [Peptoniphilus]EFI41326.1 hypothetical protein HMPREF0629_01384 [Peptoniphilus sp. oral taxon 386 str. F0131]
MKKILIVTVIVFLLTTCNYKDLSNMEMKSKNNLQVLKFSSGEEYRFSKVDFFDFKENGNYKPLKIDDEQRKKALELLSTLEKTTDGTKIYLALHDGDILVKFDYDESEIYDDIRIYDIKPFGNKNKRYYKFNSKYKNIDGVYEVDGSIDLLKELRIILGL